MFVNNSMNAATNGSSNSKKITGKVILMKKNVLEFNDDGATILDNAPELLGSAVSLQLISAVHGDPANGLQGKLGKPANLKQWVTNPPSLKPGETAFKVSFEWDKQFGTPGAFIIKNNHSSEFFLRTLTLLDVPEHNEIHFVCNSWVYPTWRYTDDRIFFCNKTYLPGDTPAPLKQYRETELVNMRGNGTGERKEWERVYDYAYYNDLGAPDSGESLVRPVLGGSSQYPYPRRGRTGRAPTITDPHSESRLPFSQRQDIYVPRDERFGHVKNSDFLGNTLMAVARILKPALESIFDSTPGEFDTFEDVNRLYEGGFRLPGGPVIDVITANIPKDLLEEIFQTVGKNLLKYPMPQVIENDKNAWRDDAEFSRQMLAGLNPVCIRLLREFPPASKLDPTMYGNQTSSTTKEHIEKNLDGLSTDEAIAQNKIFILDHHDTIMPYLTKINTTSTKTYATRTLLFLKEDGTLKPVSIELSLPHPDGDKCGAINKVYTPAKDGVANSLWQLAKAYVTVNDYGHHQLISHWLNTHAVIEPFMLELSLFNGGNYVTLQLSMLHPINKLLVPHFRDTMNINALARQILINSGGILEGIVFPGKYAMEMSSAIYKNWELPQQALPADLINRGMAVEDPASPHGLRLLIEDYPYAVDGLDIWSAIKTWVQEYCAYYYKNDDAVKNDAELQAWWKELKEEGHGDKKDESWWPKMETVKELIDTCTVTIWVASALHAAVNFGQYSYAGYMPCRPTMSRRFMPEPGTPEYAELEKNPEKVFFRTVTCELKTLIGISLIEILSRHTSDEVYLGDRDGLGWTDDATPLEAFKKFGKTVAGIEQKIIDRNTNKKLKNRTGPVNVPYTLLFPTSGEGLTGKGILNSISI